jgi:uncharacterized protein (DUF58 family)
MITPPADKNNRFPLDASVMQRLDTLSLMVHKTQATGRPGRRRSPQAGTSMEFADYRRYSPGDDFRRIDWRAYARLERLFLRVFEAEENITVTILIDCSASMYHGTPAKIDLAIGLAAALAYVALRGEDNVIVGTLTDRLSAYRRASNGKNAIWSIGEFLMTLPTPKAGPADLNRALYDLGRITPGPGLTLILSDFLTPGGYQTGVRAVQQLRQEIALLQILSPDEIEPDIQGDWRLRDSEHTGHVEVSISAAVLQAYHERLDHYTKELAAFAHAQRGSYALLPSDMSIIDVVQHLLRQIELVR